MSFKVDYSAMDNVASEYASRVYEWGNTISTVMEKVQVVQTSDNIAGNAADRFKSYLDISYSCTSTMLIKMLELFRNNLLLYIKEYTTNIDSEQDAHIEEDILEELNTKLTDVNREMRQIDTDVESALQEISDIAKIYAPNFSDADTGFENIKKLLDDLDRDINELENKHLSADFVDIDDAITNATNYLRELFQQSIEFKTNFSTPAFLALTSVPAMLQSTKNLFEKVDAQDVEELKLANQELAQRIDNRIKQQQAEMKKRENQAKWAKAGFNIVVGLVTAVVVAAVPASAPLVVPVVKVAAGSVRSAFSAAADEYVAHGMNMDEWDTGRIGTHACIGGISGAISAMVPTDAGFVTKAFADGGGGVFEGMLTTGYDQLATYGSIVDASSIFAEGLTRGATTFAGSLVGGAIADNTKGIGIPSLDKALEDPFSAGHGAAVFVYEGGKSLASNIFDRGVSELTEQSIESVVTGSSAIDVKTIVEKMYSPDSMVEDFVGDGLSEVAKDHIDNASIDWENTMNSPSEIKQMEEMEKNGEFNIMPSELGDAYYSSDKAPLTENPIEVEFKYNTAKYDKEEFIYQGNMQEEGMNDLSVADYLDNYERYKAEGRDINDAQEKYRLGIVETIADENGEQQIRDMMKENPNLSYEDASKEINWKKLIKEAEEEISSQAALHNPDQIAGGDPRNVFATGSSKVNSSFGSQWKGSRSETLYNEILKASEGMTREEMENTRLNVKFNYESK